MSTPWTIRNQRGLDIIGNTHTPQRDPPIACVILLHGFKGYKDYGFIPVMAEDLCDRGMLVHRFNFSTSGMTNNTDTFERPDLFEQDTWSRQVEDVRRVIEAIGEGEVAGKDLPMFLIGHSRGGATALLTAGRHHEELDIAGVITLNAVARCCSLSQQEQQEILDRGSMSTASARTGQKLRINANWIQEQREHPQDHDLLMQTSRIRGPVCVIQGDRDDAVDLEAGEAIARATQTPLIVLEGGDHVLNMPNPATPETPKSVQLLKAEDTITRLITKHAGIAPG